MLVLLLSCLALVVLDLMGFIHPLSLPWHRRHALKFKYRRAVEQEGPRFARKAHWRKKPEATMKRVMYLAVHGLSCREIEAVLKRRYAEEHMRVGKSLAAMYIKAHTSEIDERRRAMRRRRPPDVAVGHTWALDLTFLLSGGGLTFTMLGILDHGSRRLLCLKELPRKCTLTLLGHLLLTMARHGVPAVIRTDNESMFTSAIWRAVLGALRVCHRRSQPGCPWQNGRIERLFGTLKPLLRSIRPRTLWALGRALNEFTWFYNHVRVHQNLGGLTPMEAWCGKDLGDVRQAHARGKGCWVQALDGRLLGYHVRC
jgi:transposase InsO family protein